MLPLLLTGLQTANQLLTAGIAITAFSLLLYALTFNLRDRVARSFAIILTCVVIVFVCDAIGSVATTFPAIEFWARLEWVGIIYLPSAYLHFSDALLATTGRPSRGRRKLAIRLNYLVATAFLVTLPAGWLVGPVVIDVPPAPHLQRTWLSWVFSGYYAVIMVWSWINFWRAYKRTVTRTSQRRMQYLLTGSLAPALGSYPYLLFGSGLAAAHPLLFWFAATFNSIMVSVLLVVMAYAVAFFGVSWPDRLVKRRLFKWLMRGPVTASLVLAATTLVRRVGELYGQSYSAAVPIIMVGSLLLFEYLITLAAPLWERWLFHGGDRANMSLLQTLEERLLTSGDLQQFLESVLAAVCDRLQVSRAFIAALNSEGLEMMVSMGGDLSSLEDLSGQILSSVERNGEEASLFSWGSYWLLPLFAQREEPNRLVGLMGVARQPEQVLDSEQRDALFVLADRAAVALDDRRKQQQVFSSLEALTPEMEMIQRLRAASRYDGVGVLISPDLPLEQSYLSKWIKDALNHYWGGPKLTENPLMRLQVVQQALNEHQDNPANALRAILRDAIGKIRPEGERRFTGEWILYNILELKFMEGRKVREVAMRLAMSEADLYRKQRIAFESIATEIIAMEQRAREEKVNDKTTKRAMSEKEVISK